MNIDPRCFGKEAYPTQAAAARQLKAQMARRKGSTRRHKKKSSVTWTGAGLMTYRCGVCEQWHIGHGSRS